MSGCRVLSTGEAGGRIFPKRLCFSPPPKKKRFPEKRINSYFNYWSYLTTILRNQWRLPMSRNTISANQEHHLFKIFRGSMPQALLEGLKNFLSLLRGSKSFLAPPLKQRIPDTTLGCCFWSGSQTSRLPRSSSPWTCRACFLEGKLFRC